MDSQSVIGCTTTVAGGRYAPGHLGELTQLVPFEMVDEALAATGTTQVRLRDLPARVAVYLVLAACLFPEVGCTGLWRKLTAALTALVTVTPTASALAQARRRVGVAPLRSLFDLLRGPAAAPRAAKHQSTVTTMATKHKATIQTPHGPRVCFEARVERAGKQPLAARFGGIPLIRDKAAVFTDRIPDRAPRPRKELLTRLLKRRCELCEEPGEVVVHQVRKLASLGEPGPGRPRWAALMARKRRKTLVVCHPCHETIHHGQPTANTA